MTAQPPTSPPDRTAKGRAPTTALAPGSHHSARNRMRRPLSVAWRLTLGLLAATLVVAGCTASGPAADAEGERPAAGEGGPAGTWVGRLDESDAFVAVVAKDDQVVAYVCEDGVIGSWFFGGPLAGPNVQLANAKGERLDVALTDAAAGTFDDGRSARRFTADATTAEVLFRADAVADDDPVVGGWIRMGDQTRGSIATKTALQPAPTLSSTTTIQLSPEVQATLSPAPMTPDTLTAATANATRFVWAAGGDSFASGEGNPERGIADPGDYSNFNGLRWGDDASIAVPMTGVSLAADVTTCHRSDEAGAPKANRQLAALYPDVAFKLGFVACGGATTGAVWSGNYTGPASTDASLLGNARITQPAQLDRINSFRQQNGKLDALYLSIGGNDMQFGPIITSCVSPLGPQNCAVENQAKIDANGDLLEFNYTVIENRINELFGTALPVFISHYPNPVHDQVASEQPPVCFGTDYDRQGETGFGGLDDFIQDNITQEEANFAFGISAQINQRVDAGAQRNGWTTITSHVNASAGHGLCTNDPHFNLNSKAVRRQGRDIPDTAQFVFSGGLLHPNDAGYRRYGDAITDAMRPKVDRVIRTGLAAPTNVRIAAATSGGSLTLRWSDRATSENGFDVEVTPARPEDVARFVYPAGATRLANGGFVQRVPGSGVQQVVHQTTGPGQFRYRVRACHSAIVSGEQCGAYSAQITGTNANPATPTNVTAVASTRIVNGQPQPTITTSWAAQGDALEYVVRTEPTTGSGTPVEVRTTATTVTQNGLLAANRIKVAACNRVGCSIFRTATT